MILVNDTGADAGWQPLVKICEGIAFLVADAGIDAR